MATIGLLKNVSNLHRGLTTSIDVIIRSGPFCLSKHLHNYSYNGNHDSISHGTLILKSPLLCVPPNHFRLFSSKTKTEIKNVEEKTKVYHNLYLFEKITFIRVLGRFAKFSCLSLMFGLPVCVVLGVSNIVGPGTAQYIIGNLVFYSVVFTSQSFLFSSRILGKMMISDDSNRMVKFSHLSLFGDRKDIYVKPSNIVPFQDVSAELAKKVVVIRLKDSSTRLLFMPEMGTKSTNFEMIELVLSGGLKGQKG